MKKIGVFAAVVAACVSFTSCSMLGSSAAGAAANALLANSNGTAAGSNVNSSLVQGGGNILGSLLSTLLGGATTSQQSILGTWTYKAPEVRFESENLLSQVGGTVVSSKIQSTLDGQLSKLGMKAGQSTFTFNQDGTVEISLGSKKTTGKYTYDSKNKTITMTGAMGLTNATCTVAVTGNVMYMLFDSSKLLSIASSLSGASGATGSLASLLGNYNGMKLGWSMTK